MDSGKTLILIGVAVILAGIALKMGLPLGRLPGDLHFKVGGGDVYIPLATCALVSVVLTLIGWFLRK